MQRSNWKVSGLAVLVSAILLGCSSPPVTQEAVAAVPSSTSVPSPTVAHAVPTTEQGPRPEVSPTETDQVLEEPTPMVRAGLHATDPNGVVLTSGRPTLVEFFAFW